MVPRRRAALQTILYIATLLIALTPAARAQDLPAPAYVAFVDGSTTLERDGQEQPATLNAPLVAGDRLRTTTGRIEVLFPYGTALDVDEYSTLDVQSPTLMRLISGRVMLNVAGASNPAAAVRYQLDTPAASVRTDGPGEYRVAVLSGRESETDLAVVRGSAVLTTERGSMPVRAGERSIARDNEAPSFPQVFNSARFDDFDRWSAARGDARIGSTSRQYLPPNLQVYGGTFDQYGAWQYAAPYGYVWYPRVTPTWRPYYNGHWAPIRPYGWTWIGLDMWTWPTHHYGRWGFARGAWFWAPASQWAPAWVSWGVAPGYVSWCPLGLDDRPVFALAVGAGDPWAGWVVVPRASFGTHSDPVNRDAVAPQVIPRSTPFVVQPMAPVAVPRTVARNGVASSFISRGAPPPLADASRPGRSAWPRALPLTSQSASVRRPNLVNPPTTAAPRRESSPRWNQPPAAAPPRFAPIAPPPAAALPRVAVPPLVAAPPSVSAAPRVPASPPRFAVPPPASRAPAVAVPRVAPAPAGQAAPSSAPARSGPPSSAPHSSAGRHPR